MVLGYAARRPREAMKTGYGGECVVKQPNSSAFPQVERACGVPL